MNEGKSTLDIVFTFRVSPKDYQKLEELRKRMGWTKSEFVRKLIRTYGAKALELPESIVVDIPPGASGLRISKQSERVVIEFV